MARSTSRLSNAVVAMGVVIIVVAVGVLGLSLRCVPGLFWRGACPVVALPTARPADLQSSQAAATPVAIINAAPTTAPSSTATASAALTDPGTLTSNSGVLAGVSAAAAGATTDPSPLASTAPDIAGSPAPSTVSTALGGPTTRLVATTIVHAAPDVPAETLDTSVASVDAAPDDANAMVAPPPAPAPLAAIAAAAPASESLAAAPAAAAPVPAAIAAAPVPADPPPQRVASIPAKAETPGVAAATGTVAPGVMIVSNGGGVTVRAGPSKGDAQVFALGPHEKVTVSEDQHGWLHVTDSRGRTGWAYESFFVKGK